MLMLAACQPALNWREVRPAGAGIVALFPCKPEAEQRPGMGLAQCEAGGKRFALSWADVPDPAQLRPALKAMPQALATKLGVALPVARALEVPGMTPLPESGDYRLAGASGVMHAAVFAHGERVYQAVMSAPQDDGAAWDTFRAGLAIEVAR